MPQRVCRWASGRLVRQELQNSVSEIRNIYGISYHSVAASAIRHQAGPRRAPAPLERHADLATRGSHIGRENGSGERLTVGASRCGASSAGARAKSPASQGAACPASRFLIAEVEAYPDLPRSRIPAQAWGAVLRALYARLLARGLGDTLDGQTSTIASYRSQKTNSCPLQPSIAAVTTPPTPTRWSPAVSR